MSELSELLDHLEERFHRIEDFDEPVRETVFELLDGIDTLHRSALHYLGAELDDPEVRRLREAHPAIAWLFDAYGVGVDERAAVEQALESIRPYIHSHGGKVDVLGVSQGIVHLRMAGACAGCTASAITLQEGIEEALREGFPGFAGLEVEEEDAAPHAPPGPTLLQIQPRPPTG